MALDVLQEVAIGGVVTDEIAGIREWRISGLIPFPKWLANPPTNGLPERLEFDTRIPVQSVRVGDVKIAIGPWSGNIPQPEAWGFNEAAALVFGLSAPDAMTALATASPLLELILDDLSFQVQEPLRVVEYEALDVTPPVRVGDMREMTLFPFPHGYTQYKLQRSAHLGTVWTNKTPTLRADYSALLRRVQDAVDWYIKGLHAGIDADQYVFYWISVEILRGLSDTSIEEPARLRCGHEIASCPECGRDTAQVRQAATTYAFLESLDVDNATARRLWAMRHLVHGAKSFGQDQMTDLAELVQVLRAVVVQALKRQLGYADDEAPVVVAGRPAVGGTVGLGGSRAIEASDLTGC